MIFPEFYYKTRYAYMDFYTSNNNWYISSPDQTDFIFTIKHIINNIWSVNGIKYDRYGDITKILEIFDLIDNQWIKILNKNTIKSDDTIEYIPSEEFPLYYHNTYYNYMFLSGNINGKWSLCPPNQMDWQIEISELFEDIWLVKSCRELEEIIRIYEKKDEDWNKIFEFSDNIS